MSVDTAAFRRLVDQTNRVKEQAPDWVLPVRHFSPSSLGMLMRCPEQYRQRYILGRKERPTSNLTLGTAAHNTIEHNLIQKKQSHEDLPVREVVEYFNDEAWPKAIARDGGKDEIEWTRDPEEARKSGVRGAEIFHETVAPRIQPVSTEESVTFPVEGIPVPLFGKIDTTTVDRVIDYKTSSKKVNTLKPQWRLQGGIYMLFKNLSVDWMVITTAKEPSVVTPLESEGLLQPYSIEAVKSTMQIIDRLAWTANAFMSKYGADHAWPAFGYATDACGWCGYKKFCPAWGNG